MIGSFSNTIPFGVKSGFSFSSKNSLSPFPELAKTKKQNAMKTKNKATPKYYIMSHGKRRFFFTSGGGISPDSTRLRKSSTEVFLGMNGDGAGAAADDDAVDDVLVLAELEPLPDSPIPPETAVPRRRYCTRESESPSNG